MNAIQAFLLQAKGKGSDKRIQDLEHALTKAECENAELKMALANMQLTKEKYQMALIEVIEVLQKYGCVG